ncbi:hypothetical protein RhiirA4_490168 [Rhizophagus irregularis]|uniref:Crinkler effector protein N-terminal domain-containing protein n=1 Tax=Rhizophagus irregularis TaxID=588596 RepID=A0A2I1HVE2_9GLOM|nr:hypothetical protein RhiirA4_490168 [Rhizophagus irregularis]
MTITLFCRQRNELKKVIKAENVQTFANVDAKDIKLWKVTIPDDRDLSSNLTLQDHVEFLATREIGDYCSEKPHKKHIHILVEPPVSTTTSSEVLELREQLASLQV